MANDPYDFGVMRNRDYLEPKATPQASDLDAQAVADRAPSIPKTARATPKTAKRATKRARADDSYDPNLDPSAQVGVTARASQGPDGLRFSNAERGKTFKKGGSVRGGRGDGLAVRGRTKGRFI